MEEMEDDPNKVVELMKNQSEFFWRLQTCWEICIRTRNDGTVNKKLNYDQKQCLTNCSDNYKQTMEFIIHNFNK